jgi:Fibronectin type III domain
MLIPPPLRTIIIAFQTTLIAGFMALIPGTASATTFFASESGCGANSIWQAIEDSNATPGVDTIEISAGAQFGQDSTRCGGTSVLADQFIGTFTESAIVIGNGAKLVAQNTWITTDGILIPSQRRGCPVNGDAMISQAGRVFEIGEFGADNSGITVTVEEFHAEGPGGLFAVRSGAELEVSNSRYENIWNVWRVSDCDTHAIVVEANATFTARNTQIIDTFSTRDGIHFDSTTTASTISAFGTGATINLDRVRIEQGLAGYAVFNTGGTTNIVSSIFDASGGFYNGPGSTMNIVNTAWSGRFGAFAGQTDQIHNRGTMQIEASTFWVPDTQNCRSQTPNPVNLCPSNAAPLLNDTGSSMALKGSAVGTDVSQVAPDGWSRPVTGETVSNLGDTWIGPTRDGPFAYPGTVEWINSFVEPDPDTGSPGLDGIMPVIDVLGNGVLIDRIECNANPLINPIDSTSIDIDVLGNPRCDGNDRRNIGAVQTQTAPHLVVNRIGDGRVDLTWAAPANCPTPLVLGGYNIYRRLIGDSFGAPIVIDGASILSYSDTSVTNGQQYEYEIKARCGIDSGGFIEVSESAMSNIVAAAPIGPIGTPAQTTSPGVGQVDLTWTTPDLGGRTLLNYFITYFPVGTTDYRFETALTTATTITGLTNGTEYQFMVFAITTSNENGGAGLATAIPTAIPIPSPNQIPAIDHYGITLLALLMLGLGAVGVRRFT